MGELWRDLVDLLRRRPVLWLPVLLADLLSYLLNMGRNGLLQALVFHETTHRSALGGAVVHTPMSAATAQTTTLVALLLTWTTYFLRILLYSEAFLATAALVWAYLDRAKSAGPLLGAALKQRWGGAVELALRALAVYAVAAVLFSWLSSFLLKHGYTAVLRNAWFGMALGLLVLLVLATTIPSAALRVVSGGTPDRQLASDAQLFAALLALIVSALGAVVGANSREMAHIPAGARYPLELIGSLVVALPYVLLFTGLAVMARKVLRNGAETDA